MKYKGALIGCGAISRKHIDAFEYIEDSCELTAVCDLDTEKAGAAAARYSELTECPSPKIYSDYKEMLETEKPDIAAIATSSSLHYPMTKDALQAGCHVILEKPIALAAEEMDSLIDLADEKQRKTAVCYISRYAPHILKLREAVEKGRFGRILNGSIQVNWNRNNEYYKQASWRGTWDKDGGALMNQCTHGIDLLQWMMNDKAVKIHGLIRRYLRPIESEDFGAALIEFENGGIGSVQGSVDVYPKNHDETLSLFGEKGTVVFGGVAVNEVISWKFEDGNGGEEDEIISMAQNYRGHALLYKDFIQALRHDREPLIPLKEGRKSVDIVLGIYKSMKEEKSVELPVSFSTLDMKNVTL